MADNVTGAAGQPVSSLPLSSLTGGLQGGISNLTGSANNLLDRFFPPEKRADLQARLSKFAAEKPQLASFLLSQIALSGLPIALFATFTVGIAIFALLAALIVGVLGAVLFTVFMAGVALIILLPTLFITTFSAAFIWLWGLGLYYIIKKFNQKPVPGIHTDAKEGLMESSGFNSLTAGLEDPFVEKKQPDSGEKDTNGSKGHAASKEPAQKQQKSQQGQENGGAGGEHQQKKNNTTTNNKPKPLAEKKGGANTTTKQRSESPAVSRSPAPEVRSAGSEVVGNAGDLKKRASTGIGGLPGAQGISV